MHTRAGASGGRERGWIGRPRVRPTRAVTVESGRKRYMWHHTTPHRDFLRRNRFGQVTVAFSA